MIFQGLPSSGKSHLAKSQDNIVDIDQLLVDMYGEGSHKKEFTDKMMSNEEKKEEFRALIEPYASVNSEFHLVASLDAETCFNLPVICRFAYRSIDYVSHIQKVGRYDLLESFDVETLTKWANDYETSRDVLWLPPDKFIGDYIPVIIEFVTAIFTD